MPVQGAITGAQVANQALESDSLHKETATRFRGVEKAASAKVEHIARIFAETGYKELYEGIAWLVSHYHKNKVEILYQGEELVIDPRFWKYEHNIRSNVGLAANSSESLTQNLGAILQSIMLFKEQGLTIVDEQKIYNVMDKLIKSMGMHTSEEFVNNPSKPEELLLAQNEQLTMMVQQLQMQASNPLAEAEQVKAQSQIQLKQLDAQVKMLQEQLKAQGKTAELEQKERFHDDQMALELTKIEADSNKDVPGSLI